MQAGNTYCRMACFLLTVNGPIQILRSRNAYGIGAEEGNHFTVIGLLLERTDTFAQFKQILGRTNQQQFQFAVCHVYTIRCQGKNTAYAGGITDRTKQKLILYVIKNEQGQYTVEK